MTPILRRATAENIPALLAIERESFRQPSWLADDFLRYTCTVAEVEGSIAGFVVSRQTYTGDAQSPPECEILNVAVAPQFRRTGLATLLLNGLLQTGVAYFLEVRDSNLAAQALYRKLGFIDVGRREKYYANPSESAIVMHLKRC